MNKLALPTFNDPTTLKQAQSNIQGLGRNMAEHAYLIGCNLAWVKSQLKHGAFIPWIEKNVWFGRSAAKNFMAFARKCNDANHLLDEPHYSKTANGQILAISNEPAEIEPGQYRTVIIDPPWPYGTKYDAETRRVASPYKEMTLEAIADTEFPFADDCILWFWTTHKFLPVSFEMLQQWGFDYKATMVWNKEKIGIGYWLRMQCEFCLFAIKGNPQWEATNIRDIITTPRREHSRKPEEFYGIVLEHSPHPIGEAFARQERDGITIFTGNEKEKFNE